VLEQYSPTHRLPADQVFAIGGALSPLKMAVAFR
jgi:hypothetical protein